MNLQTVITNLRNTIAGKEQYLAIIETQTAPSYRVMVDMLKLNIAELNRILDDLVECQVKGIELSWRDNPDRSGGQFTRDEIDNANRW